MTQPDGPSFTYREWGERIYRLAQVLGEAVPPGSRVPVLSPNTHQGLLTCAGVPWSGRVLVLLNTRFTPPEYAFQLERAQVTLMLADISLAPKVEDTGRDLNLGLWMLGEGGDFEARLRAQDASPLPYAVADEDDVITSNYTPGTMSSPKGVMLTHRNGVETLYNLQFDQDSVYLHAGCGAPSGWGRHR